MIPGSAEDLIDDLEEEIRDYAWSYESYLPRTTFSDVEKSLEKALARVWQDAYDLGVRDQLASESTPGYSPSRTNPYKKDTND